jgi:hypothetical protein
MAAEIRSVGSFLIAQITSEAERKREQLTPAAAPIAIAKLGRAREEVAKMKRAGKQLL